ncbi:MAG: FKBP-type peptidyl-prolyl cis-trans isomerase [Chlamydiales bacterium]|nr:FKBP-type peptidyl-prolyl cis-trans isomerase [Chlamydiales bacterium]
MLKRRLSYLAALIITLCSSLAYCTEPVEKPNENKEEPTLDAGLVSEAFGFYMMQNLDNSGLHLDIARIIQGMNLYTDKKSAPLNEDVYESSILALQEQSLNQLADKNLQEAENFLKENAKAEGVVELIPGKLQYKIIQQGTGEEVKPHSTPTIHYTGRFADGTIFGSSLDTDEPINLPLDQTIPGFSSGLVGMKEKEIRTLFIHPDLGYGTSGQLPPNKLLIFDVEIVSATPPKEEPENK